MLCQNGIDRDGMHLNMEDDMDFQRYYDGVGLIVQNKISDSFSFCPLCNTHAEWEIVFDFKGNIICVLAKCPNCGGIIKTIFDFANNQSINTFTVSDLGSNNVNNLMQGVNYTAPTVRGGQVSSNANYQNGGNSNVNIQNEQKKSDDSGSAGWGVLGFFIPLAGFILWLVWKDDKPKSSKAAGIGCLVSVCLSVVMVILYVAIIFGILGGLAMDIDECHTAILNLITSIK